MSKIARSLRGRWRFIAVFFAVMLGALGLIANLFGARDGLCGISALSQGCVDLRLLPSPAQTAEQQRAGFIAGVAGKWSRLDRDCTDVVVYSVNEDSHGVYRIHGVAPNFDVVMQVVSIDPAGGVVTARATTPNAGGVRELWEFRLAGDQLSLRSPVGPDTALMRCA